MAAGEIGETAGWSEDYSTYADVDFDAGQSFIVQTISALSITVSGEVVTGGMTGTTVAGFNWFGNASPISQDIQLFKLDDSAVGYEDNLQILDGDGNPVATYYWMVAGEIGDEAGWSEDYSTYANFPIPAGTGFIIQTCNDGVVVTIPSAL